MVFHTGCRDQLAARYAHSISFSHKILNLTYKSAEIPKTISLPKIEYKPRAPSSRNFTGRRDYLTKLRDFFSAGSDGPHRRKSFLLCGMGGVGKTQICLKFTEENSDL